jgi:1-acyl-sn-glycerol-3-phosphate acyltransferase
MTVPTDVVDNEMDIPAKGGVVRRRFRGDYEVDPWGLDHDFLELLSPALSMRWGIDLDRPELLPEDGPALLVANRRLGWSEPFVLARGVRLATGRPVRVVGVPDLQPVGSLLRRLGGVLARPDEVAGLLRAGEVVGVLLDRDIRHQAHAGRVPVPLVAPAFELGVPVLPAALVGREVGRSWRVRLGDPVVHPAGRGPLAMAELADRARTGVQQLLDEALPPSGWF